MGEDMDYSKLKRIMMRFSLTSLKEFLGNDLTDTLIEWASSGTQIYTKSNIIDMILTVHGISILKNDRFREELYKKFDKETLHSLEVLLKKKIGENASPQEIVSAASSEKWKKSKLNLKVLEILKLPTDIFDMEKSIDASEKDLYSYDKFYELLDYQYVIRQKALRILSSDIELPRFLIHMPTGTGKTKTATHIISHHYNFNLQKKGLIIWIAHTTELLQQAYDTFSSVWKHIGNGYIHTYKFWGKNKITIQDEPFNGFMVCGLKKLISIEQNNPKLFEKLIQDTSLVVFDEAHKAAASETRRVVERFMIKKQGMNNRALMGLSATPGRSTEQSFDNVLLSSMFENRIIKIDTKLMNSINMTNQEAANAPVETNIIKYFQDRKILSKITKEELTYSQQLTENELKRIKIIATSNGYDDFSSKALEIIGKNMSRNLKIMQKLRELNQNNIPTIVFACSVKHGQLLSAMLTIEGIPNSLVTGDMNPKDRKESIEKFKNRSDKTNILINYEVLTTGFDSTNIKCVFIARPTQSVVLYSQMIGRGLRGPQMGGNEECLLVDIKDNLSQFDENMAFAHFDNYWS